ncbi:low molecular weight phosphatase family protein [Algoriphagus formosus]|uniref:arsenate-mycothiol transferase ArsC n=1 Tax=Algoriphagus formosus TaxID=2007308 RepID=UPI003F703794
MELQKIELYPELAKTVRKALKLPISEDRKAVLQVLIRYIKVKRYLGEPFHLNFICTHNSRRSQFSQIWAKVASELVGIPANCVSGGTEVTAFNTRAVDALSRQGFKISSKENGSNPYYFLSYSDQRDAIEAFSKTFCEAVSPDTSFAAVMTCAHADENCPYIPHAEERIPVRYEDPKAFDDTPLESEKYEERSLQIASEMLYVFSNIKSK